MTTQKLSRVSKVPPRLLLCRAQNLAIAGAERVLRSKTLRCPCCGWSGLYFRSFAVREYIRNNVICPRCGSFERHRALALFYPKFFSALPRRPKRILHFAPEPALRTCIESACESYERSALVGDDVEHHLDLTNLDFPASACDIILLNHVLDCMPDDRAAIREMWRVLKPSGVVVAVVAYEPGKATRELPPKSNTNHRAYGSEGLVERFVPFSVSALNVVNDVSPGECKRFGIPDTVWALILRKSVEAIDV